MEDENTVLLSADWPLQPQWRTIWKSLSERHIRYGWRPMEHVFISVPALASKHVMQAHPFTIASAAPEDSQQHAWFNLVIRAHDGFTRDLLEHARFSSEAMVRIDGPYGSLHALEMLKGSDIALMVIGGSGIAVAYPLIWALLHSTDAEAGGQKMRKVGLMWVVHEASHIDWIGHERLEELKERGLQVCIPAPTSKAGRPDVAGLTGSMIQDLSKVSDVQNPQVGVVVSGPDGMNRAARITCARMAWDGVDINVAIEKYGW